MKEIISETPFFCPVYHQITIRQLFERKFKLIRILSGSAEFTTSGKTLVCNSQEYIFVTPGSFSTIRMIPSERTPFRMICLNFSDKFIISYQKQNPGGIRTNGPKITNFEKLNAHDWLNALYASLSVYVASGKQPDDQLLQMKLNECLYILNTQYNLNLFSLVTDKINTKISLSEFIENNFMFNAPMQRFAELSGRSLSSFKRECQKIWGETPAKVIMEKRLIKAHQLLHEGKRPSEIFFDLGFETLAHFSRCFKNRFGMSPTQIRKEENPSSKYPET